MGIQIKKFRASSLQKALDMVRDELGDDAIILQTDPIRGAKTGGLLGGPVIEVTAAVDRPDEAPKPVRATIGETNEERAALPGAAGAQTNPIKGFGAKARNWFRFLSRQKESAQIQTLLQPPATTKATPPGVPKVTPTTPNRKMTSSQDQMLNPQSTIGQLYAVKSYIEPLQKELEQLKAQILKPVNPKKKGVRDPLEDEVHNLRAEFQQFVIEKRYEKLPLPPFFRKLMTFWIEKGMTEREILQLFRTLEHWGVSFDKLESDQAGEKVIKEWLEGQFQEAHVFQKTASRIVIIVGPTGVGKTTTLVKMAAHEKMKLNRRVSFVTLDDFKIGAVDQLSHYARILEVPFHKLREDTRLEEHCRLHLSDTIFVDTYGISPKDTEKLELLKKQLVFLDPEMKSRTEIHLAIPANMMGRDMRRIMEAFSILDPNFLIFTKKDETDSWGAMFSALLSTKTPVSFVTTGQNVPDDMVVFSKEKFIDEIVDLYENDR